MRAYVRSDRDDPKCKKSMTDSEAPRRAQLLSDRAEPSCKKSRIETDDPMRAMPNKLKEEASRAK